MKKKIHLKKFKDTFASKYFIYIIIGLLIFGHFFGIIGMIIATPCIALLKVIYRFIVNKFNSFV